MKGKLPLRSISIMFPKRRGTGSATVTAITTRIADMILPLAFAQKVTFGHSCGDRLSRLALSRFAAPGDLGNAPKFLPHRLFGSSKAGSYSDVGNGFSENHRRQSIIRSEPKFSRRVKRRGCFKLFSVPSWSVWTHLQFAPSAAEHVSHYLEY